jgi:hypothetical protein
MAQKSGRTATKDATTQKDRLISYFCTLNKRTQEQHDRKKINFIYQFNRDIEPVVCCDHTTNTVRHNALGDIPIPRKFVFDSRIGDAHHRLSSDFQKIKNHPLAFVVRRGDFFHPPVFHFDSPHGHHSST